MKCTDTRQAVRSNYARLSVLSVTLASILATGTVEADYGTVQLTQQVTPKPLYNRLEIQSDGSHYTGTADGVGRIDTDIWLSLSAGNIGRIKSWRVWIQSAIAANIVKGWSNLSEELSESYPIGSRPEYLSGGFGLPVNFSSHGANYCNLKANHLRRQGYSNTEIFAVNRTIPMTLRPAMTYDMSGAAGGAGLEEEVAVPGSESWGNFDLVCLAHTPDIEISDDGPTRDPLASIAYANLALAYNDQPTECPTHVLAQTLFTSSNKGRFTVRLRDAFGHASQPIELHMQETDRVGSHYVKTINQGFQVGQPDNPATGTRPSLTGGTGELVAEQHEEPPLRPGGRPSLGTADQLSDHEGDPNEHVNSVWVEIVEAGLGSVAETDHEEYRIHCQSFLDPDNRGPQSEYRGIMQSVEPLGVGGARAVARRN